MKPGRNPTKIAFAGIICSLFISAIVGIFVILIGDFDETEIKILGPRNGPFGKACTALRAKWYLAL